MKQWFVVHTQPSKELLAVEQLRQQGFEAYLPRYQKVRRHARKIDTVLSPLFPRYVFVNLDRESDQWRRINGTRGVSYILTNNEQPVFVPDGVIQGLQKQEGIDGALPISSLLMFEKGDKVRIREGSFEGNTAIFEALDDKERVYLLLNFLGRETKIVIPLYAIEVE